MKTHFLLLALVAVFGSTSSAEAAIITYQFSGTVTTLSDSPTSPQLPADIQVGSTATGFFSYDNAAPGVQFYHGTALQLSQSVTIDNKYTFQLTTPTSSDEIDLFAGTFGLFKRGPDVALPFGAPGAHLSFLDAFSFLSTSDDLAVTQLSLGPNSTIGISNAFSTQPQYFIGITPTTLSQVVTVVPEPSSVSLLGLGLAGLIGYALRRRKEKHGGLFRLRQP
jgi:hypothetical protein